MFSKTSIALAIIVAISSGALAAESVRTAPRTHMVARRQSSSSVLMASGTRTACSAVGRVNQFLPLCRSTTCKGAPGLIDVGGGGAVPPLAAPSSTGEVFGLEGWDSRPSTRTMPAAPAIISERPARRSCASCSAWGSC
jgi:hypothetical protein